GAYLPASRTIVSPAFAEATADWSWSLLWTLIVAAPATGPAMSAAAAAQPTASASRPPHPRAVTCSLRIATLSPFLGEPGWRASFEDGRRCRRTGTSFRALSLETKPLRTSRSESSGSVTGRGREVVPHSSQHGVGDDSVEEALHLGLARGAEDVELVGVQRAALVCVEVVDRRVAAVLRALTEALVDQVERHSADRVLAARVGDVAVNRAGVVEGPRVDAGAGGVDVQPDRAARRDRHHAEVAVRLRAAGSGQEGRVRFVAHLRLDHRVPARERRLIRQVGVADEAARRLVGAERVSVGADVEDAVVAVDVPAGELAAVRTGRPDLVVGVQIQTTRRRRSGTTPGRRPVAQRARHVHVPQVELHDLGRARLVETDDTADRSRAAVGSQLG